MLSLVPRTSLQVEILDVSGRGTRVQGGAVPWLPPKPQSVRLSLWEIETHLQIKVDSAANVNADDLMKVQCMQFLYHCKEHSHTHQVQCSASF